MLPCTPPVPDRRLKAEARPKGVRKLRASYCPFTDGHPIAACCLVSSLFCSNSSSSSGSESVDVCQSSAFELLVKISGMDYCLRNRLLLQGRDLRAQEAVEKVVNQLPRNSECQLEKGLTSRHHQPRRSPALGWKKMAGVNTWLHNQHRAGHC